MSTTTALRIATEAAYQTARTFLMTHGVRESVLQERAAQIILTAADSILAERLREWGAAATVKELHDLMQFAHDDDPSGYHRLGFDSFTLQPAKALLAHLDAIGQQPCKDKSL